MAFKNCFPTQDENYFIFQYESKRNEGMVFVSWDIKKDWEEAHFISRPDDTFVGYINGINSKRGYLCF